MNKEKKIAILVMAPICYLIGAIGVVNGETITALIFFCAESILLVILSLLVTNQLKDKEDEDDVDDEIVLNLEQELTEYKQRIEALEKELEERAKEYSHAKKTKEEEIESQKARIDELEGKEVKDNAKVFLPPVEEDESDIETIDIIKIAKLTAKELEEFALNANITVDVSAVEESLLVRGNRSRMRIMFRNIIDNSIKYMKRGGKLIITISSIGDDIFIVLKDNGKGLDPSETTHIFELNYQGSNRISGNGLGLTQAKAIVDYYGGTIYAKSNYDKGMGIYIQLPTS